MVTLLCYRQYVAYYYALMTELQLIRFQDLWGKLDIIYLIRIMRYSGKRLMGHSGRKLFSFVEPLVEITMFLSQCV